MRLLDPKLLIKTGSVDHADWNYRPLLGWIQRTRFQIVVNLLNNVRCQNILEVGFGSGIFMPELKLYCEELSGIDIHDKPLEVQKLLEQKGIQSKLFSESIEKTTFSPHYFDYVITVSALEFVKKINAACQEIRRILKPEGFLIVVTPGDSKILDLGLRILTGESASKDFEDRRRVLLPTLLGNFTVAKSIIIPPIIGRFVPLYTGLKLSPISTS